MYTHTYAHIQDTVLSCTHAVDEASDRERLLRQELVETQERLVKALREGDDREKELNRR
jgi:hypothetical protein